MKNFKRITKRGLSLFIALVMCMSVMSLTAFAEDDVENLPIIESEEVELIDDLVETEEPAETEKPVETEESVEVEEPTEVGVLVPY